MIKSSTSALNRSAFAKKKKQKKGTVYNATTPRNAAATPAPTTATLPAAPVWLADAPVPDAVAPGFPLADAVWFTPAAWNKMLSTTLLLLS